MSEAIDVLLPVHNEGKTIGRTLEEFYETVVRKAGIGVRFVICEDGSTDDTVEVVRELGKRLPIKLITGKERKGYSRAVVEGLRSTDAELVACIDGDGQCDPGDFPKLVEAIKGTELAMGYRNPRADHWIRLVMSRAFGMVYGVFFPVKLRDPSCPYLLIRRGALMRVLRGNPPYFRQGLWWEFSARARAAGIGIVEVPVGHRLRGGGGGTQVYKPGKVAQIAWQHFAAFFKLKRELKELAKEEGRGI